MAADFNTCGGSHLAKKSELVRARAKLGALTDVLIVEDEALDAERLRLVLREALALLQARGIVPNVCAIFSVWCSVAARTPPSFRATPVVLPLPQFE
jgi:hypothetical protein